MTIFKLPKSRFNWRLLLIQTIANALALGLTVLILPGIHMPHDNIITELLASGVIFGLLNGFVRPILQLVMFRYLFLTFGLVLVVINFLILRIMGAVTPDRFQSDNLLSLILASILVGVFGLLLESLMGVQPPIIDNGSVAQSKEQVFSLGSVPIYVPTTRKPEPEVTAAQPALTE
jgi:putative membrane protein